MDPLIIGCDVSKSVLDVSYIHKGDPLYLGRFSNDTSGFKQIITQLKRKTDVPSTQWFICFENTGVYSKAWLEWLISQQIACKEENALTISKSLGIRRGKNDQIDSKKICRYAFEKRDILTPSKLSSPQINKIKKLLSRRQLLVKQKHALEVSLKEQAKQLPPELLKILHQHNEQLVKNYQTQIKMLEKLVEQVIDEQDELKKNAELVRSVVGIGPVIAAHLLAYTENFTKFKNSRKFACYSGVAPFPNQSGIRTGKNRISPMANKKIKSLLSNAVAAAIKYDEQIGAYYLRKLQENKAKGIIMNNLKNKLIQRVYAVIKRQTPYVKMNAYV